MINKMIDGIVRQIRQSFVEEKYEIYTEAVKQSLKEPCFSVLCLNPSLRRKLGSRFLKTVPFIIRYWPKSDNCYGEGMEVLEELQYLLRDIEVDGFKLHSAEMTGQMVDGVLQLQVTYETFVMEKQEDQDKFESYEIRTGVGGLTDGSKE